MFARNAADLRPGMTIRPMPAKAERTLVQAVTVAGPDHVMVYTVDGRWIMKNTRLVECA